jgi:glycerol-3-phosphate dehydrogenase (NAD(P)+)
LKTSFETISVIGSGSWGTALAHVLAGAGHRPILWGRDVAVSESIASAHENSKYLPGLKLHPSVTASNDLVAALEKSQCIVCSIPTQQIRSVFGPFAPLLKNKIIVNSSKGIEIGAHLRVSEVFAQIAPTAEYLVLSGPSFAEEVVKGLPAALTLAGPSTETAKRVQNTFSSAVFRLYTSSDVVGVEIAGALKNVVAIASGMVSGLKLGHNAQAAVITRGLAEIARLGKCLGAQPLTFLGLAGMGDLVLTCTGPLSRNRRLGEALGLGKSLSTVQKELGGVAEGYFTAKAASSWAQSLGVEMPILREVYGILYEGTSARDAVSSLMRRNLKEEIE